MTNEAEAREVHATVIGSEDEPEQVNGDQAERPDLADGDEEIIDPDAIIVEEVSAESDDEDDEDEDEDVDEDAEDGPHPDTLPAGAVPASTTRPYETPADAIPVVSAPAGEAAPEETLPDAIPAASAPADEAASDETSPDAIPAASALADEAALDETPPDGIPPVTAPASPAPVTAPASPASSASVPGTARPGLPKNTDLPEPTDMAGDPEQMHERWAAIQSTFVDDPRGSVAAAADLVTEAIATLVASAEEQERGLRGEWERDGVDTEGLRNALRGYRGLLDHLITR
jgi:hypothetical protein